MSYRKALLRYRETATLAAIRRIERGITPPGGPAS